MNIKILSYLLVVVIGLMMMSCAGGTQTAAQIKAKENQAIVAARKAKKEARKERDAYISEMRSLRKKYPNVVPDIDKVIPSARIFEAEYDSSYPATVFFSAHSSYLNDVQKYKLAKIVEEYNSSADENVNITLASQQNNSTQKYILIEGHSDANIAMVEKPDSSDIEESEEEVRSWYNSKISANRAIRVRQYLLQQGIPSHNIIMYAHGSLYLAREPKNSILSGYNRRAEVRIVNSIKNVKLGVIGKKAPKVVNTANNQVSAQ